ncbi:galectin-8-like isoform X2 [Mercenaria mercenaria]|uniref:galectin-8-like isoform X2 n=1 Tax=Mercenaria mercenaria TaxID=6596 RepID=UPI00234E63AD|nr:galectin-8-like isoform X2 [Mercenaria mercenaria]
MSDTDRRRMDGDTNHRADIDRASSGTGRVDGSTIDEFRDRRQFSWYPRDSASSELSDSRDPRHHQVIPVPFVRETGILTPSNIIFICGVPHPQASRFTVYLQKGDSHEPPLVAMCVDARFVFGGDRNIVVRNHKDGNWGREERNISYFPFRPNASFEMIILVEQNCFKVAVNNKHMLEFNHRITPGDIDTVRIDGDVTLHQVRIQY